MEDAVDEADAGGLVWVGIGELDVDLPDATLKRSCYVLAHVSTVDGIWAVLTLCWAPESYEELLPGGVG